MEYTVTIYGLSGTNITSYHHFFSQMQYVFKTINVLIICFIYIFKPVIVIVDMFKSEQINLCFFFIV